jgi:hypothetical protein
MREVGKDPNGNAKHDGELWRNAGLQRPCGSRGEGKVGIKEEKRINKGRGPNGHCGETLLSVRVSLVKR